MIRNLTERLQNLATNECSTFRRCVSHVKFRMLIPSKSDLASKLSFKAHPLHVFIIHESVCHQNMFLDFPASVATDVGKRKSPSKHVPRHHPKQHFSLHSVRVTTHSQQSWKAKISDLSEHRIPGKFQGIIRDNTFHLLATSHTANNVR